jgi:hypothetical protein
MTPTMVPPGMLYAPASLDSSIANAKREFNAASEVGLRLASFLGTVFPIAQKEADELGLAVARYLQLGLEERIETLEEYAAQPQPPAPSWAKPYNSTEALVELCKRRDRLQAQIDAVQSMIDGLTKSMGEKGNVMADAMRAQMQLSGIPQQLEDINEQISQLQRSIEQSEAKAE